MTKQAPKEETDINNIMERYVAHGQLPPAGGNPPTYGDFSDAADYHTSLNLIREAENTFASLPSRVREHAANDPGVFLDQVNDPDSQRELLELGLDPGWVPASAPEPSPVPDPSPAEPDPVPPAVNPPAE